MTNSSSFISDLSNDKQKQESSNFLFQLISISDFLEQKTNLEEGLREIAAMTTQILNTNKCSIMLLQDAIDLQNQSSESLQHQYYLRVFTHHGNLPKEAYQQVTKLNDGIAGHVAATGKPLLVKDISKSQFVNVARNLNEENKSFISAPIFLSNRVIGVINVGSHQNGQTFDENDLEVLKTFALFVGKSIHIVQLQNILKSRFVEQAVARELEKQKNQDITYLNPTPAKLGKIVAKGIFRELCKSGFGQSQIISITTEILNLLQNEMNQNKNNK